MLLNKSIHRIKQYKDIELEKEVKMSTLKKIQDEHRESKFGYVYAVSGPGK